MGSVEFQLKTTKIHLTPTILTPEIDVTGFNCGNSDLNDFLKENALEYQKKNIVQTTCVLSSGKIIGYYSLACDALRLKEKERFFAFNKENKGIKDFPAIKLARMAFIEKYKRNGLGRHFISVLVGLAWDLHEKGVGCRFITVDAYSGAVEFYKKCGFEKNQADKYVKKANNVSMRLDIFTYGDKES